MGAYLTAEALAIQGGIKEIRELTAPRDLAAPLDADFRQAVKETPGAMTGTAEQQAAATEAAVKINTAIDRAEALVDHSLAAAGYSVPLTTPPDAILQVVQAIAVKSFFLYSEPPDGVAEQYRAAMTTLKQIREGTIELEGETLDAAATPTTRSRDQIYDDDLLALLPGA